MREISSVGVVGGGLMGSGIAESVAAAGVDVTLCDVDDASVQRAGARIESSLGRAVERGKLTDEEAQQVRSRIVLTTQLEQIASVDLVIEAVPEDRQLKLAVMAALSEVVAADAVIASNTSSIPITELAAVVSNPGRVIGLHFFSPVPVMGLVEIVVALETEADVHGAMTAFVKRLGKTAIESRDRAGFIVNMLLVPYLLSAVRMLEQGLATPEDIDAGMKLGCGHPMGPLTLSDFIGLDVVHAIGLSLYEEFRREEYMPPPLLSRMVTAGRLGRKSGRGFYEYR